MMTQNEKFLTYEKLLREWGGRMNLVAKSTMDDIKERHIGDSLQLIEYLPVDACVVDLGSGAGFPAVPLAIKGIQVTAIESIGKKCAFLNELKSQLDLPNLTIINNRIENVIKRIAPPIVITARAFAGLEKILDMTVGLRAEYILLKGESAADEIAAAKKKYDFDYKLIQSRTGPGFIVIIKNVKKTGKLGHRT
ncbi:MAG: 16S rRNA (guanine(527)-N(7))-methyltransferase RsmG [Alphaproteobacteria bacterium]|nr:16S rRNA (guanine(527)-N(7))-methyltransferase RsmG [Alphaproteobacteria bacterium]MCL2757817.1 16S rRNA (guanine(527)-N(7))-methyltransferase RsmG [Alphaproteobacteria bacterium]